MCSSDLAGAMAVPVESAEDMKNAVMEALPVASALIMAAAVADWKPAEYSEVKGEKQEDDRAIQMVRTPDILMESKGTHPCVRVGFAAQTHDLRENALRKLEKKDLHFIVANPIGNKEAGFGASTNEGLILTRDGLEKNIPLCSKQDFANVILDELERHVQGVDHG